MEILKWKNTFSGQDHLEREKSVDVIIDVDPDIVRKGIRNLMQQVGQIERERVCRQIINYYYSFKDRLTKNVVVS